MTNKKKVEVFSAGGSMCKETIETVKRLAGSYEVVIHDMNRSAIVSKARHYGIRSLPAVVIDGKLASCCAGRGPDEDVLRAALAYYAKFWHHRPCGGDVNEHRLCRLSSLVCANAIVIAGHSQFPSLGQSYM